MSLNVNKQQTEQYGGYENFQVGSSENVAPTGFAADQDTINKAQEQLKFLKKERDLGRPSLPAPTTSLEIKDLANLFKVDVNKYASTNQSSEEKQLSDSEQKIVYEDSFHDALTAYAQENNLSQDDVAALRFAFYNPGASSSNSKLSNGNSLGEVLQNLVNNAQTESLQKGVSTSAFATVDGSAYNLNISDSYNIAFEKLLNQANLTPDQKAAIRFAHYNPGSPGTSDAKVLALLKNLENGAMAQTSKEYGLPKNWKPTLNSQIYNGTLQANFEVNLQVAFNSVTEGLSDEDISAIKNAIQNMDDPSTPPSIKQKAQKIINQATTQTKSQNTLPSSWQPDPGQLKGVFESISSNIVTQAFVQVNEMTNSLSNEIILLTPESVEKAMTMDMLQAISQAIIAAQNSIYDLQRSQSEVAKDENTARLGMMDQKIRERQEEMDKVHKQSKKQHKMSKVMKTLKPIMKASTIIMTLVSGPVGLAVYLLDDKYHFISKGLDEITKGVCEVIDKMIPSNGSKSLERFKYGLKSVMEVTVLATMLLTGGFTLFVMIGPMEMQAIVQQMITDTDIIKNFCLMCGVPKDDIQWVVLGVSVAFTLTVAIASLLVPGAGEAQAAETAAQIAKAAETGAAIAEETAQTVKTTMQQVEVIINISSNVMKESATAAETATTAVEVSTTATKTAQTAMQAVENTLTTVANTIKQSRAFQKTMELLEKVLEQAKEMQLLQKLSQGMKFLNLGTSLAGTANSTLQGFMSLSQMNIAKAKEKHEPTIVMLEAMLKNLQKILDNLLDGLSGHSEELSNLAGLYDSILSSLSQTLTQTTNVQMK